MIITVTFTRTITLDHQTHDLLEARADAEHEGNASAAIRTYIKESGDHGMRLRRELRPDLDAIHRLLGLLRSERIPGNGIHVEQIALALGRIEEKVGRVTTG